MITTTRCSVVYRYLSRFFLVLCRIANDLENEKSGLYKTTCTLISPLVEGYLTRFLIERKLAIEFAWSGCCDNRTWVCVNVLVCASMGLFVWPWQWISEFYFQTLVWVSEWVWYYGDSTMSCIIKTFQSHKWEREVNSSSFTSTVDNLNTHNRTVNNKASDKLREDLQVTIRWFSTQNKLGAFGSIVFVLWISFWIWNNKKGGSTTLRRGHKKSHNGQNF